MASLKEGPLFLKRKVDYESYTDAQQTCQHETLEKTGAPFPC